MNEYEAWLARLPRMFPEIDPGKPCQISAIELEITAHLVIGLSTHHADAAKQIRETGFPEVAIESDKNAAILEQLAQHLLAAIKN